MEMSINASKQFGSFRLEADFTVTGQRIGLFGPSGSGKSTLVGLVVGLHQPDHGIVSLDGEAIFDSRKGLNLPVEQRRVGMVFQRPHLFPHLNVKHNLLTATGAVPRRTARSPWTVCRVLQIEHLLNRGVAIFPVGKTKGRSAGPPFQPQAALMDEPLSGLDDSLKSRSFLP